MIGRLPISLLSALVWGQLAKCAPADPTITPPAILPRQNADNFIGWLSNNGTWGTQNCDAGQSWYQTGSYAQCCPTTTDSCPAYTGCISGSLILPLPDQSTTSTIACEASADSLASLCNTVFIYENTLAGQSDRQTQFMCGRASLNWSYYRSIAASLTETSSTTASSSASTSSPALSENTPSTSTSTSAPTSTSTPVAKEESKAWIAGAVVGPIAGLALIGAMGLFLVRRKKNRTTLGAGTATAPPGVEQYSEAKPFTDGQGSYNQGAYNGQESYAQYGQSPNPQYSDPYKGAYAPVQTAELGDGALPGQSEVAELGEGDNAEGKSHTPELSGETTHK